MNRKLYIIAGVLFISVVISAIVYENYNKKKVPFQALLERSGPISATSEWKNTKSAIQGLQNQIRKNPSDLKSKLMLALAYMQEARITGEHPYYYPAALELIDDILDRDPEDESIKYEAIVAKSSVLLSLHHFEDALETGQEALELNPNSASIYGVMCDANVELGRYDTAVKMADKMVSLRPDIRSYARVSYLREIYGDMPGAIEAMKLAVTSGYPGLEQTAWTRYTLGSMYERTGKLQEAAGQYNMAILEYPNYAFAIGGLGRLEALKKNYPEAIKLYKKAGTIIPEFSFQEALAEVYQETGKKEEAAVATKKLIEMLEEDADAGHYVDLEMANIYIQLKKDYDKALEYAENEFDKRPENIDVNKTLAHIYYKKNDLDKAKEHIKTATRTNKQEASMLCLAGLIDIKTGKKTEGIQLIKKSFEINPFQNDDLTEEATKVLNL